MYKKEGVFFIALPFVLLSAFVCVDCIEGKLLVEHLNQENVITRNLSNNPNSRSRHPISANPHNRS